MKTINNFSAKMFEPWGSPKLNSTVDDKLEEIHASATTFIREMFKQGASPLEVIAISQMIVNSVIVATNECILCSTVDVRRAARLQKTTQEGSNA